MREASGGSLPWTSASGHTAESLIRKNVQRQEAALEGGKRWATALDEHKRTHIHIQNIQTQQQIKTVAQRSF